MTETPAVSADQPSSVRLTAGDVELTVRPEAGCRIGGLRIGGTELLRQGPRYGCFPMVPWCGRTGIGPLPQRRRDAPAARSTPPPHAIHGTGRDSVWRQAARRHRQQRRVHLRPGRPVAVRRAGHPDVRAVARLADGARCRVETTSDSFPAQAGWHPWFLPQPGGRRRGRASSTSRPPGRRSAARTTCRPAAGSPPGPGPWDDCFGMPDGVDATLTWPGRAASCG